MRRRGTGRRILLLTFALGLLGCNQILGIEPGILDEGDGGADAAADAADAAAVDARRDAPGDLDGPKGDALPDALADAGADDGGPRCADLCGTAACGACPATTMIAGAQFQIDATEVTNAAYAAWLATNPDPAFQATRCLWNATFAPLAPFPVGRETDPVVGVDWCDAYAYCTWARKRLCGKVLGGAVPYADFATVNSQWHRACTPAVGAYPYGSVYGKDTCNGLEHAAGTTVRVGSLAACEGGLPGLFDMSGNVAEWEDSCNGDTSVTDLCRVRGGSFESDATQLRCGAAAAQARGTLNEAVGFRCCRDQ